MKVRIGMFWRAVIAICCGFLPGLAHAFPSDAAAAELPKSDVVWHLPAGGERPVLCVVVSGTADEMALVRPVILQLQKSGMAVAETGGGISRKWPIVRNEAMSRGIPLRKIGLLGLPSASADVVRLAVDRGTNEFVFAAVRNLSGEVGAIIGKTTCPMCLFLDSRAPSAATVAVYRKLRTLGVPAEFHAVSSELNPADMGDRLCEYLRQMNFDGRLSAKQPIGKRFPNDDARFSYEKTEVWPKDCVPDRDSGQCEAYVEWHMPRRLSSEAVMIVFSGGGYCANSTDGTSVPPVRRYLNEKGYAVVTLKYRTPRPQNGAKHVSAWQDLQRAIRLVRRDAKARGLDPNRIGVCGGSAGGHLALLGSLSSTQRAYEPLDELDRLPCDVQLAVALFPAYVLSDGLDGPNENGGNDLDAAIAAEFAFDEKRCPALFLHGDADGYSAMGSVRMWEQLQDLQVVSDMHVFARQPHDFQYETSPGTGPHAYLDLILSFMRKNGF